MKEDERLILEVGAVLALGVVDISSRHAVTSALRRFGVAASTFSAIGSKA